MYNIVWLFVGVPSKAVKTKHICNFILFVNTMAFQKSIVTHGLVVLSDYS